MITDDWCTPRWLTDALGYFELDPCGNEHSTVQCEDRFGLDMEADGLARAWGRASVFVNPPYSNPLPWCTKLAAHPGPWVALVKLDPTTKWWAALMSARPQWAPFRKRIRFEYPGQVLASAPFPSALVWANRSGVWEYLWS